MTNFDFLKNDPQFESFADAAISAEKILHIDTEAAAINCRRAMEFAVKWMYSVDKCLEMPYQDTLVSLMSNEDFRDIVGNDIFQRMTFIRKVGNNAAHSGKKITVDQAKLCIENLYIFMDFVACCYGKDYSEKTFDVALLDKHSEKAVDTVKDIDFERLIEENKKLKEELTARREEQQANYVPKPPVSYTHLTLPTT